MAKRIVCIFMLRNKILLEIMIYISQIENLAVVPYNGEQKPPL